MENENFYLVFDETQIIKIINVDCDKGDDYTALKDYWSKMEPPFID